ncbi:hypothetical protein CLM62_08040 [Streptomyces sp. SA15]|uniref:substrate-binding domain-containing protein n=1 Tax=Streptomyces sp. SA15 TaxID=934019 RepID=UPI000BB09119|nr:substrate-binding domain-containing protein [Streptomyces sp. SA15]PAZ16501.1 hypothetical protein CLM62_08040 [Streptomyces sp. SA15]
MLVPAVEHEAHSGLRAPGLSRHILARAAVAEWTQGATPVTAVAALNDLTSLAVLASCRIQHIAIPDDLALIGVDDLPMSSLAVPALTTIGMDLTAAADNLASRVLFDGRRSAPECAESTRRGRPSPGT